MLLRRPPTTLKTSMLAVARDVSLAFSKARSMVQERLKRELEKRTSTLLLVLAEWRICRGTTFKISVVRLGKAPLIIYYAPGYTTSRIYVYACDTYCQYIAMPYAGNVSASPLDDPHHIGKGFSSPMHSLCYRIQKRLHFRTQCQCPCRLKTLPPVAPDSIHPNTHTYFPQVFKKFDEAIPKGLCSY